MPPSFADTANYFFVSQDRPQGRTPVHRRLRLIGKPLAIPIGRHRLLAVLLHRFRDGQFRDRSAPLLVAVEPGVVQHEKDPLRPTDITQISGRDLSVPVVAEAEHLQLPTKRGDISFGTLPWGCSRTDGMLFGRQTKGIKPHRVDDAGSPHPLEAADNIGGGVAFWVPHMQTVPAGIGKHVENVGLAFCWQAGRAKGFVLLPPGLPLRFNYGGVVFRHRFCWGPQADLAGQSGNR